MRVKVKTKTFRGLAFPSEKILHSGFPDGNISFNFDRYKKQQVTVLNKLTWKMLQQHLSSKM